MKGRQRRFDGNWLMLASIGLGLLVMLFVAKATSAAMAPEPKRQIALTVCVVDKPIQEFAGAIFAAKTQECANRPRSFGHADYWAISEPIAINDQRALGEKSDNYALVSAATWQKARTIYVRYTDGVIVQKQVGEHRAADTIQLGAQFADLIPRRIVPIDRIAWHIEGAGDLRRVVLRPQLMTVGSVRRNNLILSAVYAGVGGLLFGLIVHHLMLWSVMRHRFQLVYVTVLSMTLLYTISSSGITAWIIPELSNLTRLRANYAFLGLTTAASLAFAKAFFEREVFGPSLTRLYRLAIGYIAVSSLLYSVLQPVAVEFLAPAYLANFFIAGLFFPVVLWRAWHQRSRLVLLFGLGWLLPIISMGARLLNGLGIIPPSLWIDNSTILALSVESMLSALAVVWQIKSLSQERDTARLGEIAALHLADTDPLTGLLNRRAFMRLALGRQEPQQLAIIDVDEFRQVNERMGHNGGDAVLVQLAAILRKNIPAEAIAARFGGDEFAILTPANASISLDKIKSELRFQSSDRDRAVTASIGIGIGSTYDEDTWNNLYEAADRELYTAKIQRREQGTRI